MSLFHFNLYGLCSKSSILLMLCLVNAFEYKRTCIVYAEVYVLVDLYSSNNKPFGSDTLLHNRKYICSFPHYSRKLTFLRTRM